jgi:small subunit ribosomal protein S14
MSKKSIVVRQQKRSILVERYKKTRQEIKEKIKKTENLEEKISIHNKIQRLPRNSSKSRLF